MCVNIGIWSFHHDRASSKTVSEWWIQVDEFKLGLTPEDKFNQVKHLS